MRSVLFAILTGLIGAALLHIVIILGIPHIAVGDANKRVADIAAAGGFVSLAAHPQAAGITDGNPYLRVAVCSFSVADGPMRFQAEGRVPFWSLAVFDAGSNEVFSMNDQTSVDGTLDFVVATPAQLVQLRKALPETLAATILVETTQPEGHVVLRALAPADSFEEGARSFLAGAVCDALRPSATQAGDIP